MRSLRWWSLNSRHIHSNCSKAT